jgi:hypothetical protein
MLDDMGLELLRLSGAGYCCSQIFVKLALDEMGRDNPDLLRAMAGLCHGAGDCAGTCGVLSGAACVLGLHAGKGGDMEQPDERLALMLEQLNQWFRERCAGQFGGIGCGEITGGNCSAPDQSVCGALLNETYAQVRAILAENGFDPSLGRDDDHGF